MRDAVIAGHAAPAARLSGGAYRWLVVAVLALALALRLGYVAVTPGYTIVADARDYDVHAQSIAAGHGFSKRLAGKPTAFRPPGYAFLLAGVYRLTGAKATADRIHAGRILGALLGTLLVGLTGALAHRLWGRRSALVAMALAAVYVPLILIGAALMSETLFTALMLGALLAALDQRVLLAGFLAGLAIVTRANGLAVLAPLCFAVWDRRARGLVRPALLAAVATLVVAPWTLRNYEQLHHFVPVTTQFGSALAGTYNDMARQDAQNPASWRTLPRIPELQPLLVNLRRQNEAALERRLRRYGEDYIRAHPTYVAVVAYWNTRRMLDLASWEWSRHTARTVSVDAGWADAGVICFWIYGVLALFGIRWARAPWYVWAVPALMYLSVVFLAVETPRYRTPLDPFLICLAALALTRGRRDGAGSGAAARQG